MCGIIAFFDTECKLSGSGTFEAEQQPTINPKDILLEPRQLNVLVG
jgi:hypothetical protein